MIVYGLAKPLPAGTRITEAVGRSMAPRRLRAPARLYWADLAPRMRFGHPSILLLIDVRTRKVLAQQAMEGFPLINGRPAPFLGKAGGRLRLYTRLVRLHVSAAGAARVHAAEAFAVREAKARRHTAHRANALAHASADAAKTALITLVGRVPYETFPQEGQAITQVFSAHGVATNEIQAGVQLKGAVDAAVASGKTSVTVFLDGHGSLIEEHHPYYLGSDGTKIPLPPFTGSAGFAALEAHTPPGYKLRSADVVKGMEVKFNDINDEKAPVDSLSSEQLAQLAEEHPGVQFNFIIVACHSGGAISPLSVVPNIASVTTSSAGNQTTVGSYGTQGILTINPIPGQITNVAPYVAAEVYTLDKAFTAAGPNGDVTSVIKQAQDEAPAYDAAAIAGAEDPSSPWVLQGRGCNVPPSAAPNPEGWFTEPAPPTPTVVIPGS